MCHKSESLNVSKRNWPKYVAAWRVGRQHNTNCVAKKIQKKKKTTKKQRDSKTWPIFSVQLMIRINSSPLSSSSSSPALLSFTYIRAIPQRGRSLARAQGFLVFFYLPSAAFFHLLRLLLQQNGFSCMLHNIPSSPPDDRRGGGGAVVFALKSSEWEAQKLNDAEEDEEEAMTVKMDFPTVWTIVLFRCVLYCLVKN